MLKFPLVSWRRSSRRAIYGLITCVVASSLILTNPQPSQGQSWLPWLFQGVQIIRLSTLSDQQEIKIGQQINQELIRSGQIRLSRNVELQKTVNRIGQRLARASSRPTISYTFRVVEDRAINAFATMGGFVYVNTGLIAKADNEAELASVMAHEIGHIAARHAVNQMRDLAISRGLLSAAGLSENTMVQLGMELAINLPNSREAELEADRLGLRTLSQAGYAPIGMITFMEKLMRQGNSTPAFLSTHPATSQRLEALEQAIDTQSAYQGNGLDERAYRQQILSLL